MLLIQQKMRIVQYRYSSLSDVADGADTAVVVTPAVPVINNWSHLVGLSTLNFNQLWINIPRTLTSS